MPNGMYDRTVTRILKAIYKRPVLSLIMILLLTAPAELTLSKLEIDTNLMSLLPKDNKSVVNNSLIEDKIGDRGHFIVFLESENRDKLVQAANYAAAELKKLPDVDKVRLKFPMEFISKYGFTLIPNDYLETLYDMAIDWEAKANPFVEDLGNADNNNEPKTHNDIENEQDMNVMIRQYLSLPEYYESRDGKIIGIMIPTAEGISSIGKIKTIYSEIGAICKSTERKYSVRTGIGGNHRNKINELDTITGDLNTSGLIASVLIILLLVIGFRAVFPVIAVLIPLIFGLIWGFAIVSLAVGPLNLITSFLILIMFGMGVDFSIHLVKRYILELENHSVREALIITYQSTGVSVTVSGLTTALALAVLAFSGFRGFSEFGIIAGISILCILLAMYIVLPSILIIFSRYNLFRKGVRKTEKSMTLPTWVSIPLAALALILGIYSIFSISFDYNLSNMNFDKAEIGDYLKVREKHGKVFSKSMSPAAIYLAKGIDALDKFNAEVRNAANKDSSMIGRIRSIRDFAPVEEDAEERLELIEEIKDILSGSWADKVEDEEYRNIIKKIREWEIPEKCASVDEIPDVLKSSLVGLDSNDYLLTIYPEEERKDGRNAMKFTRDLYALDIPDKVQGPVGETVIFAELLWLVFSESAWIGIATFAAIVLLVWLSNKSIVDTLLVLIPLILGIGATLGIMSLTGLKISFFNIVVIPALLGMGVDGGVHYIRRWRELGKNVSESQKELTGPLSLATFTTLLGYSGMVFAHHTGIESIGIFACLGLFMIWFATLVILPGILKLFRKK